MGWDQETQKDIKESGKLPSGERGWVGGMGTKWHKGKSHIYRQNSLEKTGPQIVS